MARKTKLDAELTKKLCKKIELGMPYTLACKFVGISYQTFLNWKERARQETERVEANPNASIRKSERPYVEFFDKVRGAEAKAIETNLQKIGDAASNGSWQAAAYILKCRYPEYFNDTQNINMKAEHSGGITIELKSEDCSNVEN
jgi:hypothetical protein